MCIYMGKPKTYSPTAGPKALNHDPVSHRAACFLNEGGKILQSPTQLCLNNLILALLIPIPVPSKFWYATYKGVKTPVIYCYDQNFPSSPFEARIRFKRKDRPLICSNGLKGQGVRGWVAPCGGGALWGCTVSVLSQPLSEDSQTQSSHGQILALACRSKPVNGFNVFSLGSQAGTFCIVWKNAKTLQTPSPDPHTSPVIKPSRLDTGHWTLSTQL